MALDRFTAARQVVREASADLDPQALTPAQAAEVIEAAAEIQRFADRILLTLPHIDDAGRRGRTSK